MSLDDLYKEVILDHYKSPRNKTAMDGATVTCHRNNPLCGDEISIHARLENGTIADIAFEGQGCSISQASASMLTEAVKGATVADAGGVAADFRGMMEGRVDPDEDRFGDLIALHGVARYPVRIKCAVLAWDVLQEAIGDGGHGSGAGAHGA
ncbi:MAG: SUF system NifU family Fe-S cluster assembly protein [Actinomycetota bacterium]|nr:SUF system NifU family Fe-S cluster assembly protein [Actinomycetota bacterium]